MKTFIGETIDALYTAFGERISGMNLLLPSKRARLFINEELVSRLQEKPVWQPNYLSVDTLMQRISGLRNAERLRLVAELYKVYAKYHRESFDSFYYWGETLLSDFDMVDNYMVDARKLFININDLKDIDHAFEYLEPEQAEAVRRFWRTFGKGKKSAQQRSFLSVWNTLYPIYTTFRERLFEMGYGYKGMIYRHAAEKIGQGQAPPIGDTDTPFAVIGFNALSAAEKILFSHLQADYGALFFWDDDICYTGDKGKEAGLFMRENRKLFPDNGTGTKDNYLREKNITIVDSPSDSLQCKYVWEFLEKICRDNPDGRPPGKETAVVLTDESLLVPVLYSIPPGIEHFNVTSGYPLRLTASYTLVEYLIQLQQNRMTDETGTIRFYHKDVTGLLSHPYIRNIMTEEQKRWAEKRLEAIRSAQQIYIGISQLQTEDWISAVFSPHDTAGEMSGYLTGVLDTVITGMQEGENTVRERDYLYRTQKAILNTANIIANCGIDISVSTYLSFLRKHLKKINIAFEGDPLTGIQIMGILETRILDFENVLLLSVNEDGFPGGIADSSFIPSNLRAGYGLPTLNYHEAMYAYYFYRVLQRARNIEIVYCSKSDGLVSGEPSRFIQQLRLESEHTVRERNINLRVSVEPDTEIFQIKDDRISHELQKYLDGRRRMSPSALFRYIQCPYSFYLRDILGIREPVTLSEELEASDFGTILHGALQELYDKAKGRTNAAGILREIGEKEVGDTIDRHIRERFGLRTGTYNGMVVSSRRFLIRYLLNILAYDTSDTSAFILRETEYPVDGTIVIEVGGRQRQVVFHGIIDRVDELPNGLVRLIDYKSGRTKKSAADIGTLFLPAPRNAGIAVFQIFLYALLFSRTYGQDCLPALYFAREMQPEGYSSRVKIGKEEINRFSEIADLYEAELKRKLEELFDLTVPLAQNRHACEYCPYAGFCRK